ncbi:copper homeostasis protein CutC [Populibacterium corticicola]|uniref:PF03932 family protein CutC n=1 Tax=Populibacterium corticicola TaxID=1812826 RepID=A0ABW5XL41_9MICO
MTPALEIAVQDIAGALIARNEGADRVELCAALGVTGGLTPTAGMIDLAAQTGIDVHVLIRHRPGGFVYSVEEVAVLENDIMFAVSAGAAGVVIGALTKDRTIDVSATKRMITAARLAAGPREIEVTFHRAFDVLDNRVEALRQLRDLGVDRVLTSGGAATVPGGLAVLEDLVNAQSGVQIMAGGGVTLDVIDALVGIGVDAVHLSAKTGVPDPGVAGPGSGAQAPLERTDVEVVRAAVAALRK